MILFKGSVYVESAKKVKVRVTCPFSNKNHDKVYSVVSDHSKGSIQNDTGAYAGAAPTHVILTTSTTDLKGMEAALKALNIHGLSVQVLS